jgi:serine/threonine-protein kinase/endoribonuclease IRE1
LFALELCQASLERLFLKEGDPRKYCGPMPPPAQVLYQLATGLDYIHKMKLVHRDLKPENVLIWVGSKADNKILMKWSGFGLCEPVDESGSYDVTEIKGTLNYLAPEILKLKILKDNGQRNVPELQKATLKSDVFGEGLVFGYFLSHGKHPFGSEHSEIQSNIINQNPVNVESKATFNLSAKKDHLNNEKCLFVMTEIEPQCSQELILKMLADEPENRKSSSDVVDYLEKLRNQTENV